MRFGPGFIIFSHIYNRMGQAARVGCVGIDGPRGSPFLTPFDPFLRTLCSLGVPPGKCGQNPLQHYLVFSKTSAESRTPKLVIPTHIYVQVCGYCELRCSQKKLDSAAVNIGGRV